MGSNRGNSARRHDDRRDRDNDFEFNISNSPGVSRNLGAGDDEVKIRSRDVDQIRITFTSAEVGNGNPNDSDTLDNQDGGLAVRVQAEDAAGNLVGPVSRFDDEGITFKANRDALFDVRDLVSGVSRGLFDEVILGTDRDDELGDDDNDRRDRDDDDDDDRRGDDDDDRGRDDDDDDPESYYINGGRGDDEIYGGALNDFLVGGAGNDLLVGRQGNDGFIGGAGNDVIRGGQGNDTANVTIATDGSDRVNLGEGLDRVVITSPAGTQIRLTFTSAEVGNGDPRDADLLAGQDGRLAVRVQLEDATGALIGAISRYDDEGISFIRAVDGQTFDVRDLVSGVSRGDGFEVVRLGTSGDDLITDAGREISYYDNGGAGNDTLIGGTIFDFLVGGTGNDNLDGREGDDSLLGGAGADVFTFSGITGDDEIVDFVSGTDRIDFSAFASAAVVATTAVGADTVLGVDTTTDGVADFQITLTGVGAPLETDYIF